MADSSNCWKRKHLDTVQSDHGHGLYATQDIPRGKTILTEYPEKVIQFGALDGTEDIPKDAIFGENLSTFDDFLISRAKAIHGKNPTLLYLFPPESPGSPKSIDGVTEPEVREGEIILVTPSIVNHSCAPNMFRVDSTNLETRRLECRFVTTRNINVGDQLTILYDRKVFKWELPHIRRAFLSAQYGFFCRCHKCISQSGWRDLMLPAPAPAERIRQVLENQAYSEELTLPLTSNKHIVSQTPPRDSASSNTIPLQNIGNSAVVNKAPRKERFASWLGTTSLRTKKWLKNVPGEAKKALGENKIPTKEPGPPKPGR